VSVVELRQYTLHPGKREVLVELFDSELVEPQEAAGMKIIGQFRDLDRPDRFVWVRGFPNLDERARSLAEFYGGPVWKAHREKANATMVATDDVLLLRPAQPGSTFMLDGAKRSRAAAGFVEATIVHLDGVEQASAVRVFEQRVAPAVTASGRRILGYFVTDPSENTFPSLPVREGEDVLVWFAGFAERPAGTAAHAAAHALGLTTPPEVLRLAPTSRSLLDGHSPSIRKEHR
jgi:NIPSNAP